MSDPTHPASPRRSRAGMILLIIGAVILVLSVVAGVLGAVLGFGTVMRGLGDQVVMDEGSGSVELEAGQTLAIYRDADTEVRPECLVTGPQGEDVEVRPSMQGSSTTTGGRSWSSSAQFTGEDAGTYEVDCVEGPVMVGPHVSILGIFGGVGGVLVAVFGGGLGLLLVILGVVLHLLSRRQRA